VNLFKNQYLLVENGIKILTIAKLIQCWKQNIKFNNQINTKMKKTIFFLSTILLVGFSSCSSDDDSTPNPSSDILVKKVIYQEEGGFNEEITFTYNGTKLVQGVYDDGTIEKYYYTGDLITKIEYVFEGEVEDQDLFAYDSEGRLVEHKYQDLIDDFEDKSLFVYNDNNTITKTNITGAIGNSQTTGFTSTLTIQNNEISSIVQTGGLTYTYTYDAKNSPFKNVTGYSEIAYSIQGDFELHGNTRNIITITENNSSYTSNTITYNSSDYPVSIVSQAYFDAQNFPNVFEIMTVQFIYE